MPTMKAKLARIRNGLSVRHTIRASEVINLLDELQMLLQGQDLKSGHGQQVTSSARNPVPSLAIYFTMALVHL